MAWYENQDGWSELVRHCGACTTIGCQCKTFRKQFNTWAKELPADPRLEDNAPGTWLWFRFTDKGALRWLCLVCHADMDLEDEDQSDEPTCFRISNFHKHHNSHQHRENVAKLCGGLAPARTAAPSEELFKQLLAAFQKGEAVNEGYDLAAGRVGRDKANMMLWCIYEAEGDAHRESLKKADCWNLMRDERRGRLHIRFRCSNSKDIDVQSGFLGQARNFQPDAIGITAATREVIVKACSSRTDPPLGLEATPHFDRDLYESVRMKLEAVSVDSAENEIVSARDMSRAEPDDKETDFPNCKHVLRDAAHSTRRVLSRLFNADASLKYTLEFFGLISSLIQWSGDLRQLYQECTNQSAGAVSTAFGHMRAAKHRIESWLTPLSRCCLDPEGDRQLNSSFRFPNAQENMLGTKNFKKENPEYDAIILNCGKPQNDNHCIHCNLQVGTEP